jgi:hypothetical protein
MSTEITINQDIVEINVTEQVVTIEAPSGAYPLPNLVSSVFGRVGNVVAQEGDYTLTQLGGVTITSPTNNQVLKYNGTQWVNSSDTDTGLTSVGLSMPSAFSVANSPLTANGTLSVTGAGIASQYIRGDGTLADFPTSTGGGSSVSYYLNSSVSQGTIGGNAYRQLSKTPISGSGTDITASTNGYIASYITDANDPSLLEVPAGNFNCEFYFSVNSNNHNPYFYAELYKYDGTNFTLIGSSQSVPEYLTNGTTLSPYYFAIPVTQTTLAITDRIAIRIYVNVDTKVVTLHTENNHLCQVVTTFSKGLTSLNNLTRQVQFLATGTSGTDFNISSSTATHTFNLPTASATNRGLLSSADWTTFNAKQNALTNPVTGTGTTNTLPKFTGASTIGNSNVSDSGTLITLGSNSSINGQLVIGGSIEAGFNLIVNKTITGGVNAIGVYQKGIVQSDVTGVGFGFNNQLGTQATTFTISQYRHYSTNQQTLGAGSSIGTQIGFQADNTLTGATNNYGFRGLIPSGAGRWNLYMDGTAANYLAGDTAIGTTTLGTATQLTVGGTETAVSAISRGQLINTTLVASSNSDRLVALDIAPTYTLGGFNAIGYGIRNASKTTLNDILSITGGTSTPSGLGNGIHINFVSNVGWIQSLETLVAGRQLNIMGAPLFFGNSNLGVFYGSFTTSGNFILQNGGTFTDAGFRLDVNGLTRFIGTASSDTAPLGSELAAVTGTGTNWTLAGTNLNVGGYTHTVGSVDPLTTALAAVNGTYYQIAYTITGRTTGSITINYGGAAVGGITATGATGPLASSTAVLTITPTTDFNGTVVLSIKTIGTSVASSTFASSAGVIATEIRASDISSNLFFGRNNGRRNTTGTNNTFIGSQAGINNTTGSNNTFIGQNSGQINTIAFDNTFIGTNTGANNTASLNTFLGTNAGAFNTTGIANTFVGRAAGQNNTTGSSNVMFGQNAGRFITGGVTANTISNNSIFIGDGTRAAADGQNNQIVIGAGTTGLGSGTTIIGNTNTTLTALYGSVIANGTSINASAVLQADSTTKGFLPPRMTTVQKLAIGTPAAGLMVYDTTLNQMSYFNGTIWINF